MKNSWLLPLIIISLLYFQCQSSPQEKKMQDFIVRYEKTVKPLSKKVHLAYWNAATTGKAEHYDQYSKFELEIRKIHSNKQSFQLLQELKNSEKITNSLLVRQLDVLYNAFLVNQLDSTLLRQIVEKESAVDQKFSSFRGIVDGNKVTNNDIEKILKTETDSEKRQKAWLASKQVGIEVASDVIELVKLRNKAAQKLGFSNFHDMSLTASEQSIEELDVLFADLEALTSKPFADAKAELDTILANMYSMDIDSLMPWHYHDPFFQETPLVYELDLDGYYENRDVKALAIDFFSGINMSVTDILENSDLYEREGKNPHAFCTDIDREGDVRILCNLENNERWMETILHELGHAVYDKYQNPEMPFLLREPAHAFATEGIAMLFGRLSRDANWMQQMLDLSNEQRESIEKISVKYARLKQLVFARWAMVMYNFEKQLYADPTQDVNTLWWHLVEKYQFIKKPAGRNTPDWAAKIHIALYPVYYHNYLLGELFASQLHFYIVNNIIKSENKTSITYVKQKKVGDFLKESVFEQGNLYHWNKMIENATGERLTATYFVNQLVSQ